MAADSQFLIRPSELHITVNCPGSLAMQNGLPDVEHEEAKEGTAAHEAFAALFQGLKYEVGGVASNGVPFDINMLDGAELFHKACKNRFKGQWYIEQPMGAPRLHPQCGGTPDGFAVDMEHHHIYIGDFKYGHRYVDPYGNYQMLAYLDAIAYWLQLDGLEEQHWQVTIFVVQPRAYRPGGDVTQWVFNLADARAWFNKIISGVQTALLQGAPCKPGPYCRDCRAQNKCIALQREAASILAATYPAERFELDPEQTGRELARLRWAMDTLKVRVEGLEEQAKEYIRQGKAVPLWTVERNRSKLDWDPAMVKSAIGIAKTMGVDLIKEIKPLTPTQARDKGFDGEALGLTVSKPGSLKLVPFGANNPINGVTQHGE